MRTQAGPRNVRRLLGLAVAGLVLAVASMIYAGSDAPAPPRAPALTFAVSPGAAPQTPADLAKTIAALRQLNRGPRSLVVHLYSGYSAPVPWTQFRAFLGRTLGVFERAGFDVELVLRYAPFSDHGSPRDVPAFVALVRRVVEAFGASRRFTSIQVTNEPDRSATVASDGHFNRSDTTWQALIRGVIAAKSTARAKHFKQLRVGFNYANHNQAFWRYLRLHGGTAFRRALDWIGIDTYPGTFTPLHAKSVQSGIAKAIRSAVELARHTYMPLAGIPNRVALHFSENGYATSAGRTYAMQATALRAAVNTVASLSRTDHVTEYDWFELRDGNSTAGGAPDQLGLLRTDYRVKPAFTLYRRLIQDLG